MNKILNINLAGVPFVIDESAYSMLSEYLDTVQSIYGGREDCSEIPADIEARMSEIFADRLAAGSQIISLKMVEDAIRQVGNPQEFDESLAEEVTARSDDEEIQILVEGEEPRAATPPPIPETAACPEPGPVRRRLFRDPDHRIFGGVCAGLAAYLNCDVVLVRIIAMLLLFFSGSTIAFVYFILWIAMPEAHTPGEKMQMHGISPTIDNIGQTITDMFSGNTSLNKSGKHSGFWKIFGNICLIFIAFALLAIGFSAVVLLVPVGAVVFGAITDFPGDLLALSAGDMRHLFFILLALLIVVGGPLFFICRSLMTSAPLGISKSMRNNLLIVWTVVVVLFIISVRRFYVDHSVDELRERIEAIDEAKEAREEAIEAGREAAEEVRAAARTIKDATKTTVTVDNDTIITIQTDTLPSKKKK